MKDLLYELKALTRRCREGSYATQANRAAMLQQMGTQLLAAGYRHLHAYDVKGRHVHALLRQWQAEGLSPGTIKNRMAVLRWWAAHIGKPDLLKPANTAYAIPKRQPVAPTSKARELPPDVLAHVRNRSVRMALELQRAFGLRREESIKLKPWQADHGDRLVLHPAWCKGGHGRSVPIRTAEQREVLERAKTLVRLKEASLIPQDKSYIQQVRCYESWCRRVGLSKMHGLRHAYAQARYQQLTGWGAPAAGGPPRAALTPPQRVMDDEARLVISEELGHHRLEITAVYLGR